MQFADAFDQADTYADRAIDYMRAHKIPPIPSNYAVWYAYASNQIPDLVSKLNAHIAANKDFTTEFNVALYDQFFSNNEADAMMLQVGQKIGEEVSGVLDILGTATDQFAGFQKNIKSNLEDLSGGDNAATDFEGFMQSVIQETWKMQDSNEQLQSQLQNSASEIEDLRESLEVVQRESLTDGLTGIANRKKFDATLKGAMNDAQDTDEALCLAIADIDFFKKFNDTFGHQVGDQVLKLVAMALDQNVKGRDLAARYGGEEFALILPMTGLENAIALTDQVRKAIASKSIRKKNSQENYGNVTMSFGVAEYRKGESIASLIERADAALYKAKDAGRNCCKAAE